MYVLNATLALVLNLKSGYCTPNFYIHDNSTPVIDLLFPDFIHIHKNIHCVYIGSIVPVCIFSRSCVCLYGYPIPNVGIIQAGVHEFGALPGFK